MKRNGMFYRIIAGSLRHRALRVAVASLSIVMGASLVAALAGISLDVGSKAGRELRSYGANLVLTPKAAVGQAGVGNLEFGTVQEERYLDESQLGRLDDWEKGEILGYSPLVSATVEAGGTKVPLVGALFERVRALRPWWAVKGEWARDSYDPSGPVPGMLGMQLAGRLGLNLGDSLPIRRGSEKLAVQVVGIVETGGDEDGQLFIPLPSAQQLLGKPGMLSSIEVSAVAERRPLQEIAGAMEKAIPEARVRVVGQIADAEASTLGKVRVLVGLVAALVLLASGLAVASTMAASVMERTREIGLMKALGAGSSRIALVFLAEAAVIGLLGGAPGYLLGVGLTQVIGRAVFGSGMTPSPLAIPLTLVAVLAVCLLASILPIRRALAVDPAVTLRGE